MSLCSRGARGEEDRIGVIVEDLAIMEERALLHDIFVELLSEKDASGKPHGKAAAAKINIIKIA